MNTSIPRWLACATLALFAHVPQALADDPTNPNWSCVWAPELPRGPLHYHHDVGTLYVPRDAPIGTVIGGWEKPFRQVADQIGAVRCLNDGSVTLTFNAVASLPVFPGSLPPINGEDVNGKVLQTSIPGVGVVMRLTRPFDGLWENTFTPIGGRAIIPFDGYNNLSRGTLAVASQAGFITVVKIGEIGPGAHSLDGREIWHGIFTNVGTALHYNLLGTIIQAQCSLRENPVSADPVELGEWSRDDFTGPGFTTRAVSFQIALNDCVSDPDGNVTTAHIRLDGVKGSLPIEAEQGIFGLSDDSTAAGIGIQLLMADGVTPVRLGDDVPVQALVPFGDMSLPFTARFYQTGSSSEIRPGVAKGALSFTITYQ